MSKDKPAGYDIVMADLKARKGVVEDGALDELVLDIFDTQAADLNNEGIEAQVVFLLTEGVTVQEIVAALNESEEIEEDDTDEDDTLCEFCAEKNHTVLHHGDLYCDDCWAKRETDEPMMKVTED